MLPSERVSIYRLVYPDGNAVDRDGDAPVVGHDVDGFRVDFVRRRDSETVVYLGLHYGQTDFVKLVFIDVAGERCPLTLAEAAELAERSRAMSLGNIELPLHAVAVRLEQLVEEGVDLPVMSMLESERTALQAAIARWVTEDSDDFVPMRVRVLRDSLARYEAPGGGA